MRIDIVVVSLLSSCLPSSFVVGEEQTETITGCWENNIVPYRVGRTFSSAQKLYLRTTISRMNRQLGGCLRWVNMDENLSDAQHFALLYPAKRGCITKQERGNDGQMRVANISLADHCFDEGVIMHHLMHALGFHHEHQRSDRDCYVFVDPSVEHDKNYVKFNRFYQPTMERFPYDKTSVMHFRRSQVLKSRSDNFLLSEPFAPRDFEPIGNWKETLTDLDVWKIQFKFCSRKSYCAVWPNECHLDTVYEKKCVDM